MKKLNQIGDTIIEVLLAIAVLSVVLGGAYAITNRSYTDIREAQEHGTALKYAEQQAERLKQLAGSGGVDNSGTNSIFNPAFSPFCVNVNGTGLKMFPVASCTVGIAPVIYTIKITRNTVPLSVPANTSFNFKVEITWPSIHGGNDQVILNYRLDK